jgi:preprotein translocase subunit SecA
MGRIGMEDGVPIEHRWISRAIENAQKKVESHNFDIRKHLLEYDDVMNKQREVVYHRRRELLSPEPLKQDVLDMCEAVIEEIVAAHCNPEIDPEEWDWTEIENGFFKQFRFRPNFKETLPADKSQLHPDDLIETALQQVSKLYDQREEEFTPEVMRQIEKIVSLQTLDALWKDHLLAMDHLKEGIGLRGYAQQNPLVEYQKEGFSMFEALMDVMQKDIVEKVYSVQVQKPQDVEQVQRQAEKPQRVMMSHGNEVEQSAPAAPTKRDGERVGRNDPCPCGSGKKYKRCHGK